MGFFDDIRGRTAEFSGTVKLKNSISEETKVINNLYNQLGQQYYALHKDNSEPELASLVAAINDGINRITEYNNQITALQAVDHCTNCGAELPRNAAFCVVCGTPVAKPQASSAPAFNQKQCPNCNALVSKENRFCTSCGFDFNSVPAQPEPTPAPAPQETGNVCPACGAPLEPGSMFCTNCGNKVR